MHKNTWLMSVGATLLAIVLSVMFASSAFAQALKPGWNGGTALCSGGYYQTGANQFGSTDWFSITTGRVGVLTAGWIAGYEANGATKVTLDVGDYNFELVSGAVCVGESQAVNAWLRQTCPQCTEGILQGAGLPAPEESDPVSTDTPATSAAAPAQAQFVPVGGVILNRDLNECYTEPTGVGVTVAKTWNVGVGRTLWAFAWSINGSTRPAWVSVPGTTTGNVSLTVTDGIVVICSSPLAFTPEVFDEFTEMKLDQTGQVGGGHLLTEPAEVIDVWIAQAGGNAVVAQINWVKAHNQELINQQRGGQAAPAPQAQAAAPAPAPAPAVGPVRYTNSGSLNFSKGETVFGAYIKLDGAPNAVGMCYFASAPSLGTVSGGVIGRMPFEQEIREQKLVSCG